MRLAPLLAACLALGLLVAATRAHAQAPTEFTVQGTVLDPMRMPIAGARITAVPDGQTSGASTVT